VAGYNFAIMLKSLAVTACLLILGNPPQANQKPANGSGASQTSQSDQRGTKSNPLAVDVHTVQSDQEAAREADNDAWEKHVNVWNIGLTCAIALCALAQVFVYLRQTHLLNQTLAEVHAQAGHMKEQTGILKQSADISRGAAVPTLRMLRFNMSGSDPLVDNEMELTVRNYGATPAVLDALYISFDDGERWPTAEGASVAYDDRGGRAVAANSDGTLHCSPTICLVSPRLIPRFRTELKSLYAHGRLKYLDVFESPVRSLRFDVCLSPRQNGTIHCEIIGQWNEYELPQKAN
jgi:hypothetical protein